MYFIIRQNVIEYNEEEINRLLNNQVSAYNYIIDKLTVRNHTCYAGFGPVVVLFLQMYKLVMFLP